MFGKSIPIHRTPFMTEEEEEADLWTEQLGEVFMVQFIVILFSPFMLAFDQPAPFGTKGEDPFQMYPLNLWRC